MNRKTTFTLEGIARQLEVWRSDEVFNLLSDFAEALRQSGQEVRFSSSCSSGDTLAKAVIQAASCVGGTFFPSSRQIPLEFFHHVPPQLQHDFLGLVARALERAEILSRTEPESRFVFHRDAMTFLSCLFLNRWLRDKDFPYVPRWFRHTSRHNRIPKSRKWRIR